MQMLKGRSMKHKEEAASQETELQKALRRATSRQHANVCACLCRLIFSLF
jgi:hypothetical protein